MMKSILTAIWVGAVINLSISSCATVHEPLAAGEVRLLNLQVAQRGEIRINFPFLVNINFEADGMPEIRTACFSFSGDGPYCYKVTEVNYGLPGTIKLQVRTKNSGSQAFESYVYYIKDGKVQPSNAVNCNIRVIP
jgi:hypothetical protein